MVPAAAATPENVIAVRSRRRIAGQDPIKRGQILAGARKVFQDMGFDAASVNDIAAAAGVSKATLYVYFENKEQLFIALVSEARERQRSELVSALEEDPDVDHALRTLGTRLVKLLTQDWVLRAQRVVLGVTERMPDVGGSFFESGPLTLGRTLAAYLDNHAEEAGLDIPDSYLAAVQYLEMIQATLVRPRLYAYARGTPDNAAIEHVVDSAVRLFMRGYARESQS